MSNLPSLPYSVRASFLEHQRKEWEKVLESSRSNLIGEGKPDFQQHWEDVNCYALEKIQEIDRQIEQLKLKNYCIALATK
jgi:hypothetical protein